jgi:multiple sugar transport system substrate-binding protein
LTTKHFFTGVLCILLLMSLAAWHMLPADREDGRILLTYACPTFPAKLEQVELFEKLNPEYQVRVDASNTGMEKTIVQSIAGVGPDFFNSYSMFQTTAYVQAGIAKDITDDLQDAGIDIGNTVWRTALKHVIRDDRVYGFPYNASAHAFYYNQDHFDGSNIPHPTGLMTQEEFLELAQKLTVRDAEGRVKCYGFLFEWWTWPHFVSQWGGRVYSEDGSRCEIDCPETIAAIQFMRDLVWKYKVTPSPAQEAGMSTSGGWGSGTITWFGGGRAAMASGGRYWMVAFRNKENYPDLRLGVVECRLGPVRKYQSHCGVVLVNKHSPRVDHALKYLTYMAGKEYNELVNRQADGLGPIETYSFTDAFMNNPDYPEETTNQVWRDVLKYSVPVEDSPFVNGGTASRIIMSQLEMVKANSKSAADAMHTAKEQINREIEKTLKRNPKLRARYEALTGRTGP